MLNLKIAFPISSYLPTIGGAQVGIHNIAIRLIKKGHNPIVIAPYEDYCKLKVLKKLPYKVVGFPPKMFSLTARLPKLGLLILKLYLRLLQQLFAFNLWHCTVGYPIGVALTQYALSSKKRIPYLIRCTGDEIQKQRDSGYGMRLNASLDKIISEWLPCAERLVAITETVATEYKKLGIKEDRIVRIPNGVEIERFNKKVNTAKVRKLYDISPDTYILLCVGRNHPKKGFKYLIETIPYLLRTGIDKLVVVFVGAKMEPLRDAISDKGLERYVRFIDPFLFSESSNGLPEMPSDELIDLYKTADVFVFPSLIETFGIVLIEAMAAGLPIVTTNAPGCSDLVKDRFNGLLAETCNPVDLSEKIITILKGDSLRHKIIENGREFAKQFDWDIITNQYLDQYQKLINIDTNKEAT